MLFAIITIGCSPEPVAGPDLEATDAAVISITQTAAPTETSPPPTPTLEPTNTAIPVPTDTSIPPTDTPEPTAIPAATDTPEPDPESAAPSDVVQTELENGDTLYELPEHGFAITLPDNWEVVDLTGDLIAESFGRLADQNEGLSELFNNSYFQDLAAVGIKFYAINVDKASIASTTPATINILKQELPVELTLDTYTSLSISQLEQIFDITSEIEQESVKFGQFEGARITYTTDLADPLGRSITVLNRQYLLLNGSVTYVITLTMAEELAPEFLEPGTQAAESFELTK